MCSVSASRSIAHASGRRKSTFDTTGSACRSARKPDQLAAPR
jgi:hypothetical protein